MGRSALCGTFLGVAPTRGYLAPCPVEPGLSSRGRVDATGPTAGDRLDRSDAWQDGPWRGDGQVLMAGSAEPNRIDEPPEQALVLCGALPTLPADGFPPKAAGSRLGADGCPARRPEGWIRRRSAPRRMHLAARDHEDGRSHRCTAE